MNMAICVIAGGDNALAKGTVVTPDFTKAIMPCNRNYDQYYYYFHYLIIFIIIIIITSLRVVVDASVDVLEQVGFERVFLLIPVAQSRHHDHEQVLFGICIHGMNW